MLVYREVRPEDTASDAGRPVYEKLGWKATNEMSKVPR